MDSKIYFLENIIYHFGEDLKEPIKYSAILLEVSDSIFKNNEDNYNYRIVEVKKKQITNIREGQFLYYNDNNFRNANGSLLAKHNFYYNNFYRGRLLYKNQNTKQDSFLIKEPKIYSYHINVGHGNCSLIIINDIDKINIWMVDCSEFDYINKQNYYSHIESCIKYASNKFKISSFKIDKFFLTHTHFDHYSGINRLIDQGIINSKTIFYINLHYSMPNENYTRLLRKINKLSPNIIEPLSYCSNHWLNIWHPHIRTIRSMTANYIGENVQIESKPNNSSVVYYFKIGEKSIVFPGDLETIKWNTVNQCYPHLKNSNYFAISHHGSLNGHLRNVCPKARSITKLSDCISFHSIPILMGRDMAYNGIYSTQVIHDFNNIVYSEKNGIGNSCDFLEIDWQSNQKTWY